MRKFFSKIFFILCVLLCIIIFCFVMPPTDMAKNYLLFAQKDKDLLLANTPAQRIVFVGGSNLTFGLNSRIFKDSLRLNPVNTALHAGIGLKYMLSNTIDHVRENDIIVVSAEYQQFYGNLANGQAELLTMVIDVSPQTRQLPVSRYLKLIPSFPKYAASKLRLWNYYKKADTTHVGIYDRKSFNEYGDAYIHWTLPKQTVNPFLAINGTLNEEVFRSLGDFRQLVDRRKAHLFVTFPCCQDISFRQNVVPIHKIEKRLRAEGYRLLGTPERYVFPDSLTFNTPYHLVKKAVDHRTMLLVQDLRKQLTPVMLITGKHPHLARDNPRRNR